MIKLLLFSVFLISTCGLVYELIACALASYLLGDSITQFSTIIGTYLFSMGIGSYFSRFIEKKLYKRFIEVEILVGLIGGLSALALFLSFEYVQSFKLILYGLVTLLGILVGLEIPLITRILKNQYEFKDLVSQIFTFDYIGALLASLLFPLVLVPKLGLVQSALLFGLINVAVAFLSIWVLMKGKNWLLWFKAGSVFLVLLLTFIFSPKILKEAESHHYQNTVIFSKSSSYQKIVLTHSGSDLRLYLGGNLQFSSRDEYRYHEALVHIGLASHPYPRKILVLGGGDGFAVREILKYESVEKITLVDLDGEITKLFKENDFLAKLNKESLRDKKVQVVNADAFKWLQEQKDFFDFIVIDFPDPSNFSLGKLYSNVFYRLIKNALSEAGLFVVQSTSPFVAKKAFWCIEETIRSEGFKTLPYHAFIPSFGEWGFVLASKRNIVPQEKFPPGLKFIHKESLGQMKLFPPDMKVPPQGVNKLNDQILVRLFEEEWARYAE